MEEKLLNQVLLALYEHKDELFINFKKVCSTSGISFENVAQENRIFSQLEDMGWINGKSKPMVQITYLGTQEAENRVSKLRDNTESQIQEEKILGGSKNAISNDNSFESINSYTNKSEGNDERMKRHMRRINSGGHVVYDKLSLDNSEPYMVPHKRHESIVDSTVAPCFNVEKMAEIFVEQLDAVCREKKHDNVCMLGLFGAWGRGKTYFFKQVESEIKNRTGKMRYKTVTFNAWKYQEAPAIWAYLYEVLANELVSLYFRSFFRLWSIIRILYQKIVSNFSILVVFLLCAVLSIWMNKEGVRIAKEYGPLSIIVVFIFTFLYSLFANPIKAYSLISKFSKFTALTKHMGVQNEIEKEIKSLLKFHSTFYNVDRVVLFIDDVDRCSYEKMLYIIESIRTVLENPAIRKRLIVVCNIDPLKLKNVLRKKYSEILPSGSIESKLDITVREQFDKLFLSGLGLPPLSIEQKKEFVDRLTLSSLLQEYKDDLFPDGVIIDTPIQESESSSDEKSGNDRDEELNQFNPQNLATLLKSVLDGIDEELTPRQLRIIYYRIILANNLMQVYLLNKG